MKGGIGQSTHLTKGWHPPSSAKKGGICPACGSSDAIKDKGILKLIHGKFGDFLGCTRYPNCKYTKNIQNNYEKERGKCK
jgi:ssDNA-binding Zn-finger/Zn-ribbon topoisomerase 1